MNGIEDRLRRHFLERAQAVTAPAWTDEIVTRGRRARARRRASLAAAALVVSGASAWAVIEVPDVWGRNSQSRPFVPASAVAPDVRATREAVIADRLEVHDDFTWLADSGGRAVCATQELGEQRRRNGAVRVYVWAHCENRGGKAESKTRVPLAADVRAGRSVRLVFQPPDGTGYADSIRANFPRALWPDVFYQRIDHKRLARDLERRAGRP